MTAGGTVAYEPTVGETGLNGDNPEGSLRGYRVDESGQFWLQSTEM